VPPRLSTTASTAPPTTDRAGAQTTAGPASPTAAAAGPSATPASPTSPTSPRKYDPNDTLSAQITRGMAQLDQDLKDNAIAKMLSEKTGQRPANLVVGFFFLMCCVILHTHGWDTLVMMIGFSYPVYASFKALKTENIEDDTEWLTYWVVFGTFILLEDFSSLFFDETHWSPIYYLLKLVFILWLALPRYQGANVVFNKVINPILSSYEKSIDQARAEAREIAQKARVDGQQMATQAAFSAAVAAANPGAKKNT